MTQAQIKIRFETEYVSERKAIIRQSHVYHNEETGVSTPPVRLYNESWGSSTGVHIKLSFFDSLRGLTLQDKVKAYIDSEVAYRKAEKERNEKKWITEFTI